MTQSNHAEFAPEDDFAIQELEQEYVGELPERDLLLTVSLLGIPLVSISGLDVKIS